MSDALPKATNSAVRDDAGRLLPGHGMGRPKGSVSKDAAAIRQAVRDRGPAAWAALDKALAEGSWKAISWCLDRLVPAERVPPIGSTDPADLAEAISNGDVTPSEAAKLAVAFRAVAEADQLKQLFARLDEVERLLQQGAHKR
ncbi:hypothetical protein VPH46_04750 [Sphingomonas sp. MJ1 (PH-R8)]|uniref:hypothetical protein n=1 Tax=Sphingomonas sp. MJ1 (PH-R8) TaxID=3112950 RepID=UPI003A86B22C